MCTLVLRNRERKKSTSSSIRPMTPGVPDGLSSSSWRIHGSVFCWPHTVGMRKGTGDRAQRTTRTTMPMMNTANATPGSTTPIG